MLSQKRDTPLMTTFKIKKPLDGIWLHGFSQPETGSEATANEDATNIQFDVANETRYPKTEHENLISNNGCIANKPGAGRNTCMLWSVRVLVPYVGTTIPVSRFSYSS